MRVIIVSPGGEHLGGGMGTVSRNIKSFLEGETEHSVRIVDSRGEINYLVSFLFLFIALTQVLTELIFKRETTIIHINVSERSSFYRKACFIWLANRFNVKSILHHHGAEFIPFYMKCNRITKKLVHFCVQNTSENIVLGEKWRSFINEKIPAHAPISLLFNAVPCKPYTKSKAPVFTICLIANLTDRKGILIALEAAAKISSKFDFRLHFVGGGDVDKYRSLSKELDIYEMCTFHGWVSSENAFEIMIGSDVLILPSYEEGLPMVILEAMAHNIPVVCTPVGSIAEVFTDRKECLFVKVGSSQSLLNALVNVEESEYLRIELTKNAKALYLQKFSIGEYMKCLLNIYEQSY